MKGNKMKRKIHETKKAKERQGQEMKGQSKHKHERYVIIVEEAETAMKGHYRYKFRK